MSVPKPTLVRMEYLAPTGWVDMGMQNLLYPEKVVPRYREKGKFIRVIEIGPRLKPTGRVWIADDLPEPEDLVPTTEGGPCRWRLPERCPVCSEEHAPPYNGTCLL